MAEPRENLDYWNGTQRRLLPDEEFKELQPRDIDDDCNSWECCYTMCGIRLLKKED